MIKRTCKATEEERAQQKRQRPFCASSELTTYELRDRDVSCGAAPTLCCCLQHSSGFGGANMVLPLSLNPAPLEQGAELRLWARSPGCCQSAAAAWIQHGNAALAAAALMRGMEKKKNLPFQFLHYRGWRLGGRESLYCLLLGRGKKSSGPQLPRKVEAKALSCITDRSSFREIPLLLIHSSPGSP